MIQSRTTKRLAHDHTGGAAKGIWKWQRHCKLSPTRVSEMKNNSFHTHIFISCYLWAASHSINRLTFEVSACGDFGDLPTANFGSKRLLELKQSRQCILYLYLPSFCQQRNCCNQKVLFSSICLLGQSTTRMIRSLFCAPSLHCWLIPPSSLIVGKSFSQSKHQVTSDLLLRIACYCMPNIMKIFRLAC